MGVHHTHRVSIYQQRSVSEGRQAGRRAHYTGKRSWTAAMCVTCSALREGGNSLTNIMTSTTFPHQRFCLYSRPCLLILCNCFDSRWIRSELKREVTSCKGHSDKKGSCFKTENAQAKRTELNISYRVCIYILLYINILHIYILQDIILEMEDVLISVVLDNISDNNQSLSTCNKL